MDFTLTCPSQSRKLTPDIQPWLETPLAEACHNYIRKKTDISAFKYPATYRVRSDHKYIEILFYRQGIVNTANYRSVLFS